MLQILPQSQFIVPNGTNCSDKIEYIKSYINNNSCEVLYFDISNMNILDSCKITTICSLYHFMKYPEGKIHWNISSELIKEYNKSMELGNNIYDIA